MTSERKIQANRLNASRSTGPRTAGGKMRSRQNSRKHGLAMPIANDPSAIAKVDLLMELLAADDNGYIPPETARTIAEAHFENGRIVGVKAELYEKLAQNLAHDCGPILQELQRISRYERRVLSKRSRALKLCATED